MIRILSGLFFLKITGGGCPKTSWISNGIKKATTANDITKPLPYDSDVGGNVFAKLVVMKKIDDKDWRAIEKAMNELAARLPIKFVVPQALQTLVDQARLRSYE